MLEGFCAHRNRAREIKFHSIRKIWIKTNFTIRKMLKEYFLGHCIIMIYRIRTNLSN